MKKVNDFDSVIGVSSLDLEIETTLLANKYFDKCEDIKKVIKIVRELFDILDEDYQLEGIGY